MNGIRPGDRVLYRDGDCFGVARVDIVGERHVTGFPFDTTHRRWARRNRRIAAAFVIGKLSPDERADRIALKIQQLRNQRDALRRQANNWLEQNVRQLATVSSDNAAAGHGAGETPHP